MIFSLFFFKTPSIFFKKISLTDKTVGRSPGCHGHFVFSGQKKPKKVRNKPFILVSPELTSIVASSSSFGTPPFWRSSITKWRSHWCGLIMVSCCCLSHGGWKRQLKPLFQNNFESTVVCISKSKWPNLWSKWPIFDLVYYNMKILPYSGPLGSTLPLNGALKWGTV